MAQRLPQQFVVISDYLVREVFVGSHPPRPSAASMFDEFCHFDIEIMKGHREGSLSELP